MIQGITGTLFLCFLFLQFLMFPFFGFWSSVLCSSSRSTLTAKIRANKYKLYLYLSIYLCRDRIDRYETVKTTENVRALREVLQELNGSVHVCELPFHILQFFVKLRVLSIKFGQQNIPYDFFFIKLQEKVTGRSFCMF